LVNKIVYSAAAHSTSIFGCLLSDQFFYPKEELYVGLFSNR